MTDKQIIIDGVDVSGCDNLYTKNNKYLCRYNFEECKPKNEQCPPYVSNIEKQLELCKQVLKRKEQECEELKKVNEEKNELLAKLGCPTIATARMKAFTLEQQLDQLKAQLLDQEAETLKAGGIIYTLKQALTEIKEIAESNCEITDDSWMSQIMSLQEVLISILQKISEVLE